MLRALGLGDTLAAVPALRALRAAVDHRIVLAGPADPGRLLVAEGLVDEIASTRGLADEPAVPRPDIGLNLHGSGPQSHRWLQATGPRRLVAFATPGVCGPKWDDDEHERARWCRLVASGWGHEGDPDDVLLRHVVPAEQGPDVLVHPGAASGARRWPAERWAAVARELARDHGVGVTGSPAERRLASAVVAAAGLPESSSLAGDASLAQLAATIASARVLLCGDTGVAHLAYAVGTPAVVLFGPTPPRLWGPPATGRHVAVWRGDERRDPHAAEPDAQLLRITVDDVLEATRDTLSHLPR